MYDFYLLWRARNLEKDEKRLLRIILCVTWERNLRGETLLWEIVSVIWDVKFNYGDLPCEGGEIPKMKLHCGGFALSRDRNLRRQKPDRAETSLWRICSVKGQKPEERWNFITNNSLWLGKNLMRAENLLWGCALWRAETWREVKLYYGGFSMWRVQEPEEMWNFIMGDFLCEGCRNLKKCETLLWGIFYVKGAGTWRNVKLHYGGFSMWRGQEPEEMWNFIMGDFLYVKGAGTWRNVKLYYCHRNSTLIIHLLSFLNFLQKSLLTYIIYFFKSCAQSFSYASSVPIL